MSTRKLQPNAVCVFCSSSPDVHDRIKEDGRTLGRLLAGYGLDLVYGGTTCGLMKVVADAHVAAGGRVIGVVPGFMIDRGIKHPDLHEVIAVPDMKHRKAAMLERSGAIVALPGGIGTYDELFDVLAQKQLDLHRKPVILLNTNRYFDPFVELFRHGIEQHTIRPEHRNLFSVAADPGELMRQLEGQG